MKFLQQKFYDDKNFVSSFLDKNNTLKKLEKDDIAFDIKRKFVKNFTDGLLANNLITEDILNSITDTNAWSIDFPSWHGKFDEEKGKDVFVIGAEPHIHFKYLQTVYGFNNEKSIENYITNDHPIFKYLSEIVSSRFNVSKKDALDKCYLTDLFPLSPFRGNGLSVGSADKIDQILGGNRNWYQIRQAYAKSHLSDEIKSIKPKLIITQGKAVFENLINALEINNKINLIPVIPETGKKQYIREVNWSDIAIISVPHIGTKRMRGFWNNNIEQVKSIIQQI